MTNFSTTTPDRISELDGLRGIAILMVIIGHVLPQASELSHQDFPGWIKTLIDMGWAGVDLFFVLSGFLITSILLRTKNKPNYFKNFYARRILRIFPIYYIVLTFLFGMYFFMGWADLKTIFKTSLWFYLYAQNWQFAFNHAPGLYFGHLWSLAIEEQFYLIWPIIVFRVKTKQIFFLGAIAFITALLFRLAGFLISRDYGNTFPYYSTISRIDGLMFGAILAAGFQTGQEKKFSKDVFFLFLISFIIIGACIALQPNSPLWNNGGMLSIGLSALALFSGSLIIAAMTLSENHPVRRFLRHPILLFFGKYSYGLYVFHWPVTSFMIMIFSKSGKGSVNWLFFSLACFVITIMVAVISWTLIEKPVLKLKHYFE